MKTYLFQQFAAISSGQLRSSTLTVSDLLFMGGNLPFLPSLAYTRLHTSTETLKLTEVTTA